MSNLYLIQYDLDDKSSMKEFVNNAKKLGGWMKYFPKSIVVDTDLSAKEIYNKLSPKTDFDNIFIVKLDKSEYYGTMPDKAWDWFDNA